MPKDQVDLTAPMVVETKVVADASGQIMIEVDLVMSDAELARKISTTQRLRLLPFQAERLAKSLRDAAAFLKKRGPAKKLPDGVLSR